MASPDTSGFMQGSVNGIDDPTIPRKRRLGAMTVGAINGAGDPTQSVFKNVQRPIAAGAFVNPAAPAPGAAASPDAPAAPGSVFDNLRLGAGTGLNMPTFAGATNNAQQRDSAAAQDKAAFAKTYGDPSTFTPGAKPPVDIRMPIAPVFSPDSSASTILNPMGMSGSGAQPPVVAPSPAAVAAAPAAGPAMPGAAGRMASAIPTVAATGPVPPPIAPAPSVPQRALADGGVVQPDGSIAFSNIPGQPGALTKDKIDALAKTNVIPAAAFTNPGLGVATSMATGGAVTPGVSADNIGFGAIQNPASAIQAAHDQAIADALEARRNANSDMVSIATEDPRSPLGIAARKLRVDAQTSEPTKGGFRSRGMPSAADQTYQQGIQALLGAASSAIPQSAQVGDTFQRNADDIERTGMTNASELAKANLTRPDKTAPQVTMADGTLGLLGSDGVVRKAVGEDGKPINMPQVKEDAEGKRADSILQDIYKSTDEWRKNLPPGSPDLTADQITKARIASAQTRGFAPRQGKDGKWYISIGGQPFQL